MNQIADVVLGRREEVAIRIVWSIGLIGALIATLAILKEVALVLRALKDIHRLAAITREAAQGVATNLEAVARLAGAEERVRGLHEAATAVAAAAGSLEHKLEALATAPARYGS